MKNLLKLTMLLGCLIAASCDTTDVNDDEPETTEPPVENVTYILSVSSTPSEGGSVSPNGGEFDEDADVSVEAGAEPGFGFFGWEGDLSGAENPAVITMDSDKAITALFEDLRSEYEVELTLSDGVDQIDLEFGQSTEPDNTSVNAPPSPPEGALDARFEREGEEFFKDYRGNTQTEVEWVLTYQQGEQDELTLTWGIEAEQMEGTLILSSTRLDEEVDMVEQSDVTFTGDGSGSFTIVYTRDN